MKIKKSHLKELIKLSIAEAIWEQENEEKPQPPAPPKEKEDEKPMTKIDDNPFSKKDDIEEIDFKSKEAFQKYKAKHKMRGSTKVNIAGKETTVDKASGKKKKEPEMDAGGPSYANVPKGAKTSKQAKQMSKIEKDMEKAVNDANEKMAFDQVPGIRIKQITNAEQDVIRHDHIDKTLKALEKAGSNKVDAFKSLGDAYKQSEKDRNAQYKKDKEKLGDKKASSNFYDNIEKQKRIGFQMQKLLGKTNFEFDDIKESTRRRHTVKEVRMWMKKLEENRYKRVYNSDARRVAWMVNNEGRKLDEMPISMKKKWTKAQYGRERYLAKEFLRAQNVMEQKIRGVIRQIVAEEIRHTNARFLYVPKNDIKKVQTILKRGIQKGKVEVDNKPSSKERGFYRITVEKQKFNDIVEALMLKRISVKTIARGKA